VVALDKKTGDVVWKSPVPGGDTAGYASIVISEVNGVKQYIAYTAGGLVGLDAKKGKFLWRYGKTKGAMGMSILTPVAANGLVYSGAGRVGGGTVKLSDDQGTVKAEEVYFDTKLPSAIGGAVLVGDYLYGSGGQTLVCADFKTGQIKWSERVAAPAAVCYADGRLYLHGEMAPSSWLRLTRTNIVSRGALRRRMLPLRPTKWRNRGLTQSLPTAASTCATRTPSGATTSGIGLGRRSNG
jgi:outer membrane protein assembly factor BamB